MGGTLMLPYLARRAEELLGRRQADGYKENSSVASPVKFDDEDAVISRFAHSSATIMIPT